MNQATVWLRLVAVAAAAAIAVGRRQLQPKSEVPHYTAVRV